MTIFLILTWPLIFVITAYIHGTQSVAFIIIIWIHPWQGLECLNKSLRAGTHLNRDNTASDEKKRVKFDYARIRPLEMGLATAEVAEKEGL